MTLRGPARALWKGLLAGLLAGAIGWLGLRGLDLRPRTTLTGLATAIDGDSLRLSGIELRLEGLDAPELRQTCVARDGQVVPCGQLARSALADLLRERPVTCRVGREDRFGRGLALCRNDETDINRELVLRGQAVAFGRFEDEEGEARRARRGLWATRFELPADWRARH